MDVRERIYERLLVLRCQGGDAAAFAELVGRYSPRLRYYLRKMLSDADAAEDVLQEVWLAVYGQMGRLAQPEAFGAWVYRIARDWACREMRRRRAVPAPPEEFEAVADEAEDESFTPEDAAAVHAALDELPAGQREVLVLRFVEAMSYERIAEVVGCAVGTVRSRLHYGKGALRRVIEQRNERKAGHG